MKFFVRFLAVIGGLLVLGGLIGVLFGMSFTHKPVKMPEGKLVLHVDFAHPDGTQGPSPLVSRFLKKDGGMDPAAIVRALDLARLDPQVVGFVARVSDVPFNDLSDVEEVRSAVERFTAAGKFTLAWADSFGELGPANREYWLASAFGQIWLQPYGLVGLTGPAISMPFARGALDKLGITPDFHTRYEFKGATSNMTDAKMSAPLRENYTRLITDIYQVMVTDIASARQIAPDALKALIDKAPILTKDALHHKLIDATAYSDEVESHVKTTAPDATHVLLATYFDRAVAKLAHKKSLADIALIEVTGPIVRRDAGGGAFGGNADEAAADVLADAIEEAQQDPKIKALLVRVNSPGGSVAASETIRHALERAKKSGKFVLISMGGTAASGGYWLATAGDWIMADKTTITGSIGVLAGKMSVGGLADKLGIKFDGVATGANSTMWGPDAPFSPSALVALNGSLDEIYSTFIKHVSESRRLSPEKLDQLARGRVWTGLSAKENGLVDEIGGYRDALVFLKKRFGGDETSLLALHQFPAPLSPLDQFLEDLRGLGDKALPFGAFSPQTLEKIALHFNLTPKGMTQLFPEVDIR